MSDSLQKWVGRNRPPRVQITYDVEIGNAFEKKELPLVVGLMADLSGQPENPLPKFKERLLGKLDGNDELDALLENILQNTEDLKQLKGSTEASDGEAAEATA